MSDSFSPDAPRPRLCHLRKWPDFSGYGFNLHAERGKAGQFIGTVDPESPAVAANLRSGDRIIEVNGTNIGSENHQQVVQRIKAVPDETKLLVVDEQTDVYYKERNVVVRSDMDIVDVHESPIINPFTSSAAGDDHDDDDVLLTQATDSAVMEPAASIEYEARLCHLKTWPDFAGYGFNLHADRATPGQYIGKVDEGSPAEAAGLRMNDRIVEVNGQNVEAKNHAEVVAEVKSVDGEVRLLVVDSETDKLCRSNGVKLTSSSITYIHNITCPDRNPQSTAVNGEEVIMPVPLPRVVQTESQDQLQRFHTAADDEAVVVSATETAMQQSQEEITVEPLPPPPVQQQQQHSIVLEDVSPAKPAAPVDRVSSPASATVNVGGPSVSARQTVTVGGLEFAPSAKEARERMKKKGNIKQDSSLSLKDKYDLLQRL